MLCFLILSVAVHGVPKTSIVENVKLAILALSVFITIRPASKKDHLFIEIISMDLEKYMAF